MSKIKININGQELHCYDGQTILEVATENGIHIPTLCHDDRVKEYGACGICVVEAEHTPKLLRACSTAVFDGMMIHTDTDLVFKTRQTVLDLLLSDHTGDCRPPCVIACPGHTDCQGYVGLIAMGEYEEALKLVKAKIPLPGSIGRVCPHPCETACRRKMVEEPINIAALKAFVANKDMDSGELFTEDIAPDTGKRVAIIGGGPGGLTAGYFLRALGHSIDIFDRMPQMGGMLYYGIPEYRLPKDYLTEEVNAIRDMGITFHNNVFIGKDKTLQELRDEFDAVIIATGAWTSSPLRCPGEELEGVVGGIDFLRNVITDTPQYIGKNIAIVGGGNTAMDACRTAVRLGAEKVYNIYRRTKDEMPAEDIEIIEAEEEGVIFKELTNPIEVLGEDGRVVGARLQKMRLGEPDASGRRRPEEIPGEEETIALDTIIVAIGQKLDPTGLEEVTQTKWNTIYADESNFTTNLEGVFALGDATNNGADIAISAIGDAKRCAEIVDPYLFGEKVSYRAPYLVTQEVTPDMVAHYQKAPRVKMSHLSPEDRRSNFLEVNDGYTDEEAQAEAQRCLECGCHDYFECKLIDYANQYDVDPAKYAGEKHTREIQDPHPFIQRNPDKCILCGLCVRVCSEVIGETALGLIGRGFDTVVAPALELPLGESGCISCGQCINVCPTGALMEVMQSSKQVPTNEESVITTCSFCSVGCKQKLTFTGDQLLRALPYNEDPKKALLCAKGRFGFGEIDRQERVQVPYIKDAAGTLYPASDREAALVVGKKMQALQSIYGADCIGVSIGSRYTNEEVFAIQEYAKNVLHTENVFSFGESSSGLAPVLGKDGSTANFEELDTTEYVLLVETDLYKPHLIAGLHVKKAVENGAILATINHFASETDTYATESYGGEDSMELLQGVLKLALETPTAKTLEGYDSLAESVASITPSPEAEALAKGYLGAKKAIIMFEQTKVSPAVATLLGDIALAAGKATGTRNGIIQLKPGANSQGLSDLGVKSSDEIDLDTLKGLLIFGEDVPTELLPELDFLAVHELHFTPTAERADVLLPAFSYAEVWGTFTNATGKISMVQATTQEQESPMLQLLSGMAEVMETKLPWHDAEQLFLDCQVALSLKESGTSALVVPQGEDYFQVRPVTNELSLSFTKRL